MCPGRRFADIGVWQALANIVATFDIGKARTASGDAITPEGTFSSGLVKSVNSTLPPSSLTEQ